MRIQRSSRFIPLRRAIKLLRPALVLTLLGFVLWLPGGAGAEGLGSGVIQTNQSGEGTASPSWFNVRDFGAKGDGAADDGMAIRAALAAADRAGGGTVYFPHGVYRGSVMGNPENGEYRAVGILPSRVRVVGDGMGATVVGLLPNQPQSCYIFLNTHIATGGDEDITLEDLTLDGFNVDQHPKFSTNGLAVLRMRNLTCRHVRFRNVFGTGSSGLGESFHAEFGLSTTALFEGCEVVGDRGSTASGFSADSSTDITYIGCRAFGMTASAGFTHNGCSYVSYIGCRSSQNFNGFNSEVSSHVSYVGCIAGGLSTGSPAYPFKSSTPLGNNGPYGSFIINGDNDALLDGCTATENSTGVWIQGAKRVLVSGGNFSDNRNYGVHIDQLSLVSTRITGSPVMNGNGKAAMELPSGRSAAGGPLQAPAIPLSGIPLPTRFPFAATVYISDGRVQSISVDGLNTGATSGAIRLPAGSVLTLKYRKPPRWVWIGE